jgi:hypothetical protein
MQISKSLNVVDVKKIKIQYGNDGYSCACSKDIPVLAKIKAETDEN